MSSERLHLLHFHKKPFHKLENQKSLKTSMPSQEIIVYDYQEEPLDQINSFLNVTKKRQSFITIRMAISYVCQDKLISKMMENKNISE